MSSFSMVAFGNLWAAPGSPEHPRVRNISVLEKFGMNSKRCSKCNLLSAISEDSRCDFEGIFEGS